MVQRQLKPTFALWATNPPFETVVSLGFKPDLVALPNNAVADFAYGTSVARMSIRADTATGAGLPTAGRRAAFFERAIQRQILAVGKAGKNAEPCAEQSSATNPPKSPASRGTIGLGC